MLSQQEGEGTVACNQSPGTTPLNHTTSLSHHTTPLLQPQKLSNQTHQEEQAGDLQGQRRPAPRDIIGQQPIDQNVAAVEDGHGTDRKREKSDETERAR